MATDIATSTAFLYSGDHPIQMGVSAGTIEARRVAIIRGIVEDRDGQPMAGVKVTVPSHPELGPTFTRADGMFDLAVNGGGFLTANYEKTGFLPSQRQVQTPWRDFVWAPKVTLVPLDPNVTKVDLAAPGLQVASGSVIADEDGTRQARLVVKPGTTAAMVVKGQSQPVTSLSIRATEYTVGKAGPLSMPANLPPSSGYTYAVELSSDEAIAAGASAVTFSQPVVLHVDNFLGFAVGGAVPTGFFDREKGVWVASKNGRVIQVLSVGTDGKAVLDANGDGKADASDARVALGIDDQELAQIGAEFAAGKSLWRVPIPHLTPWDCNWPYGPPRDAIQPPPQDPKPPLDDPDEQCGSIIGCQDQTLGEVLPIAGTPFTLHYKSDRVPGRAVDRTVAISLSGPSVSPSLKKIRVEVSVAGRLYAAEYDPFPNLTHTVTWDGKEAYGRMRQGTSMAAVNVNYDYVPQYYSVPSDWENSFARAEATGEAVTGSRASGTITFASRWAQPLVVADARGVALLGDWSVDVHHGYDVAERRLVTGDGGQRRVDTFGAYVINSLAEKGHGIALAPDGSLFIADRANHRIRRVGPDGVVATVAGTGVGGSGGDGGPATAAALRIPHGVAVAPDGSLFIADTLNDRVRRVGPDGIITTVAGTGVRGYSGDNGPAISARISAPASVAVGPDGSLFIAGDFRIRRVGSDGIITTVAGTGVGGNSGDGGPATAAMLHTYGVATGPDGSLFIADNWNSRIRRVTPDGIITTVAGTGTASPEGGYSGDGGAATAAMLGAPLGSAVGPDGNLFIADWGNGRIRTANSARRAAIPIQVSQRICAPSML